MLPHCHPYWEAVETLRHGDDARGKVLQQPAYGRRSLPGTARFFFHHNDGRRRLSEIFLGRALNVKQINKKMKKK